MEHLHSLTGNDTALIAAAVAGFIGGVVGWCACVIYIMLRITGVLK